MNLIAQSLTSGASQSSSSSLASSSTARTTSLLSTANTGVRLATSFAKSSQFDRVRLALASVCAYANNQWDLGGDVTNDPANSSFWRALDQAEGMISVIDKNAICFTRVWARRPRIEHARALPAPVLN